MKFLIVTSNYPRWQGDSTTPFVHNFAVELLKQGQQVRVLAPHFEGAATSEVMDGVEIKRFRYLWPESAQTVCYQGGALGNLKKGVLNKLKLPVLVMCEFFALLYQTLVWRPDWIHSHWLIPQGFVATLAAKLTGTKHIATVHGGDVFALNSGMLRRFKTFVINNANTVTVNSSVTEEKVGELSPNTKTPVVRIPTGILPLPEIDQVTVSQLRSQLQKNRDEKLILFVGRLSEEKGVGDAIKALKLLHDKGLSARLIIAGEGHDKQRFIELSRSLDVANWVTFAGWVENKDIYNYFRACDVFVGPSKKGRDGWIEAQGLTFVEAMLAGCPVIGTRSGGIVDAVIPGKTGWLAEPGDCESLANCMDTVMTLENDKIIYAAKEFAQANYLVGAATDKFLRAIRIW